MNEDGVIFLKANSVLNEGLTLNFLLTESQIEDPVQVAVEWFGSTTVDLLLNNMFVYKDTWVLKEQYKKSDENFDLFIKLLRQQGMTANGHKDNKNLTRDIKLQSNLAKETFGKLRVPLSLLVEATINFYLNAEATYIPGFAKFLDESAAALVEDLKSKPIKNQYEV